MIIRLCVIKRMIVRMIIIIIHLLLKLNCKQSLIEVALFAHPHLNKIVKIYD